MADLDAQIAERVMGWTVELRYSDGIIGWRAPGFPLNRAYTGKRAGNPWSPSTDIVAAQLMEAMIGQRELKCSYVTELLIILGHYTMRGDFNEYWDLVRATPEQRCRAALLAVA
jgi:hypothetical protein